MAVVKITVRRNGPFRVEAPEGSIELSMRMEIPMTLPARRHFHFAAAEDQ